MWAQAWKGRLVNPQEPGAEGAKGRSVLTAEGLLQGAGKVTLPEEGLLYPTPSHCPDG